MNPTRAADRFRHLDELPPAGRVLTIGTFDGIHRGHQTLLARTVARARDLGLRAAAVTFEPIPAMVLRPERFPGRICTADEKLERLSAAGLDEVLTLEFSRDFSDKTAEEFMAELTAAAHPREIWVGEAFALGRHRAGDVARLTELGADLGYALTAMPRLADGEEIVSSSAIRRALAAGEADHAARLLGRPFRVAGPVIHGAHLGRTIGYPTANVVPPPDLVRLADGIYATRAHLPGESTPRDALTYVGTRPTVNAGARLVETHVLDFDGDLYGRVIPVDILAQLRPDQTFPSLDAMVAQLHQDEAAARAFLASTPAPPSNP